MWNNCVKSYQNWDVYYLYDYAYSFMLHGDGEMLLVSFENGSERFCYAVMQRDIADCPAFAGALEKSKYYDWETPYGYGGPLADGAISQETQGLFQKEILEYCAENGIVSLFVRFHPLLGNHTILNDVIETRYLRDTIYIATESPERIMENMDSKNRNMVRKAIKNNVTIVKEGIENFDAFLLMYEETMKKNNADPYYTFQKNYFESLESLGENAFLLYAMMEDVPISSSIIFYNDRYMHYHLSGSHAAYRNYSPSNLLLYEAACMASEMGIKKFHLGGGMAPDDSLFSFKKQFNKYGRVPFYVGRTVFQKEAYNKLLAVRKSITPEFDMNNGFMIQYRR